MFRAMGAFKQSIELNGDSGREAGASHQSCAMVRGAAPS
jgi:hypothetical protein